MNEIVADLHVHTTFSDGIYTPEEIVQFAKNKNLKAIAISDHDAFGGIEPAIKAANDFLQIIPAVELSTEFRNLDIHILGYFIDYKKSKLLDEVIRFRQVRDHRAEKIVKNLKNMGINIDYARVKDIAGDGAVGRPHIATALLEKGYINNHAEAFERFLNYKSPAYVPKFKIHPIEAFVMIIEAGGIPVLAHPGTNHNDYLISEFVKNGLMGIEVYHPNHSPKDIERYKEIALHYGLLMTGGTDFHGRDTDYRPGEIGIDSENLEKLLDTFLNQVLNGLG